MPTINSVISIYPSGYDLNVSGSTMTYVYDETRDPNTGNVISSGSQIIGIQVNTGYTAINNIEQTLGLNPQGSYATVAARISNIETISGSNAFVRKVGDSMSGNLQLISGAGISFAGLASLSAPSGMNWNGTGTLSIINNGNVLLSGNTVELQSANNLNLDFSQQVSLRTLSGLSNVLVVNSGNSVFYKTILPSGSINIGAVGNPISNIYATNIIGASNIGSGTFLPLSGGVVSGSTTFSGASILAGISGNGTVGSVTSPFSGVYATAGYFTSIYGNGPLGLLSALILSSGVYPLTSGAQSVGLASAPFNSAYINTINTNAVIISGVTLSQGALVQSSGASLTGSLTFASGTTVLPIASGSSDLGSQANPFNNVWVNAVNGRQAVKFKFNEILSPFVGTLASGVASGSVYTFANSPSGASVVWAGYSGAAWPVYSVNLLPNTHYTISGSTLSLTPVVPLSGVLIAPFYVY